MGTYRVIAVAIVAGLLGVGIALGTVPGIAAQDDDTEETVIKKQYDYRGGEIEETDLTVAETTNITVTVQSFESYETQFPILLYANGDLTMSFDVVELAPGESKTVELSYWALEPGEYDLTVNGTVTEEHHHIGTVTVEEREWGQSTEIESAESPDQNDGVRSVQIVGGVLFLFGALLFLAAPVLEVLRAIKYYSSDELTASMKPAVASLMAGSVGLATGGYLIGGFAIVGSFVGVGVFVVCAIGFGGYYSLREAYRRI